MQLELFEVSRHERRLSAEVVERIFLAQVHEVVDERNAWWSTWIDRRHPRYYSGRHWSELKEAKAAAEALRVQGSQWHIVELPACAVVGPTSTLLISETYAEKPLAARAWKGHQRETLLDLALGFSPAEYPFLRLVADGARIGPARPPFGVWIGQRGESVGCSLSWRIGDRKIEHATVLDAVRALNRLPEGG
jgi:hypothetical protein